MKTKLKGSIIIWVICLFLFITSALTLTLKNSYEDNSSYAYELDDFKFEQKLYSFMLYFTEENEEKIRELIYKNRMSKGYNFKYEFLIPKDLELSDLRIKESYIDDDLINFRIYDIDLKKDRRLYFVLNTLEDIFQYEKCFIDNNSDNELQNDKNKIINEMISSSDLKFIDDINVNLQLESGNYEFKFENGYLTILQNGEFFNSYKESDYRRLYIRSNGETNITLKSDNRVFIDRLFIINKGNVTFKNIYFRGFIIIKGGNMYADNISGEGRIFIDGNLISNDVQDGEIENFNTINKYALMFDNMLDFKIKLFKR